MNHQRIFLIVNADDYGYYPGVSKGILAAADKGVVTATGIFANSMCFDEHIEWLREETRIDSGVHLNLSEGEPLNVSLKQNLAKWAGRFPDKFSMALAVMGGKIPRENIEREWRAQIERCLDAGLKIRFLNSHEHIHMLPPLFRLTLSLAEEYDIPHVRYATSEWIQGAWAKSLARNGIMLALEWCNKWKVVKQTPVFIGIVDSGRLNIEYMRKRIRSLEPGKVYELMCHPGYLDKAVTDERLLGYHDWEGELKLLQSSEFQTLLNDNHVELIGYRDLRYSGAQLMAGNGE